jgi:hypothetical protein
VSALCRPGYGVDRSIPSVVTVCIKNIGETSLQSKGGIVSYDVSLFRIETKQREQERGDENFFEDENNLEPLTVPQLEQLRESLAGYGYEFQNKDHDGEHFYNPEESIFALLTERGLYFTAPAEGDAIFEAGMAASELTDTGEFAKYDPQNGGWEES